jgi:dihydropteroate synthase
MYKHMVRLVGILNVTPDSFSDGGRFTEPAAALRQADRLFDDGAALVDVGAESTRPGATPLSAAEEWQRLEMILPPLMAKYPGQISLDTYHPETAAQALKHGKLIINDVTALNNPAMVDIIVNNKITCVISHLPGLDIAAAHQAKLIDDVQPIIKDLLNKADNLQKRGLKRDQIILDPGIGFGKTQALNEQLLEFAKYVPDYAVMIGYSRKRFLGDKRMELATNLAAGRRAIEAGAAYLRVHDVAGHRQLLS